MPGRYVPRGRTGPLGQRRRDPNGGQLCPRAISWVSGRLNLWNVAITRARTHLIMVGDKDLWRRQGGVAATLLDAVDDAIPLTRERNGDDLLRRLYQVLSAPAGTTVTLGEYVNGHPADALVRPCDGPAPSAVPLDPAPDGDSEAARHLRLMLHRRKLLDGGEQGSAALRHPAWRLYDVNRR